MKNKLETEIKKTKESNVLEHTNKRENAQGINKSVNKTKVEQNERVKLQSNLKQKKQGIALETKNTTIGSEISSNKTDSSKKQEELNKPGFLRNHSKIILQTIPAQKVLAGRKNGPVGLFKYSSLVLKVCRAAAADDPYADLFLLRIYEAAMLIHRKLKTLREGYTKKLKEDAGFEITPFETEAPKVYTLMSANQYTALAARLIVEYDKLARVLISGVRMLALDEEDVKSILADLRYKIRNVLSMPMRWEYTGVTRQDVRHNTQIAQRAYEKMGELNNDVLAGTLRARFAPPIRLSNRKSAASGAKSES